MKTRFLVCAVVVLGFVGAFGPRASGYIIAEQTAVLNATTNAPVGAMGFASFSGPEATPVATPVDIVPPVTIVPTLHVIADGLLVGTYTVSVTDAATNTYVLGTFDVVTVTNPVAVYSTPMQNGQIPVTPTPLPPIISTIGSGNFHLPAGLAQSDVVGVSVADAGGLVDLTGTFTGQIVPPPCGIHKVAELIATTNAPAGAVGFALLSSGGRCAMPMQTDIAFPVTNAPSMHVTATGLFAGTYTVSVTDIASNAYVLGTFDVVMTVLPPKVCCMPPSQVITVGSGDFPLPAGLDATNVVGVTVADAGGVVDLDGTFHGLVVPPPREFREFVVLASTTNAPARAMGRAALESEWDEGTNTATLGVEASGLLVGTYTASITDTATNTYTLGTFDVAVRTNRCDGPLRPSLVVWTNTCAFGEGDFPLPAGLDPTNVVTVAIADANGLVDLTGDFTNPRRPIPCSFNTLVPLTPGPGGMNLWGNAWLEIKVLNGKARGKFSLTAYGVPAHMTMNLVVNGAQVGTIKSNRRGIVTLKKLPKGTDLTSLTSVQADDNGGHVVFSASF